MSHEGYDGQAPGQFVLLDTHFSLIFGFGDAMVLADGFFRWSLLCCFFFASFEPVFVLSGGRRSTLT